MRTVPIVKVSPASNQEVAGRVLQGAGYEVEYLMLVTEVLQERVV